MKLWWRLMMITLPGGLVSGLNLISPTHYGERLNNRSIDKPIWNDSASVKAGSDGRQDDVRGHLPNFESTQRQLGPRGVKPKEKAPNLKSNRSSTSAAGLRRIEMSGPISIKPNVKTSLPLQRSAKGKHDGRDIFGLRTNKANFVKTKGNQLALVGQPRNVSKRINSLIRGAQRNSVSNAENRKVIGPPTRAFAMRSRNGRTRGLSKGSATTHKLCRRSGRGEDACTEPPDAQTISYKDTVLNTLKSNKIKTGLAATAIAATYVGTSGGHAAKWFIDDPKKAADCADCLSSAAQYIYTGSIIGGGVEFVRYKNRKDNEKARNDAEKAKKDWNEKEKLKKDLTDLNQAKDDFKVTQDLHTEDLKGHNTQLEELTNKFNIQQTEMNVMQNRLQEERRLREELSSNIRHGFVDERASGLRRRPWKMVGLPRADSV